LTGSGAADLSPFEADVKISADELAKAYGNNSEAGRQAVEQLLDPNQSKEQLQARISEIEELLGGKLRSFQHQFEGVAPKGAQFDVLSPENRAANTVKMKFPNGKVLDIPVGDVDRAKTKYGAKEAAGG